VHISTEYEPGAPACVVRPEGDIDMSSSPELRVALQSAVNRGCVNVVLDLAAVDYADSSALSLIVWMDHLLAPRGGKLVLAGATRNVARVLELSGLIGVAPTVTSAPDASDALAGLELTVVEDEPLWTKTMTVSAQSSSLASIRGAVCDALEPVGLPEATVFDIRVAVGEALSNAFRHGSPGGEEDLVTVDVSAYTDRVVLVVKDTGSGFEGETDVGRDPYAPSGRGVMFMRALMDRVDFRRLPEGGTAVTLVKHVGRPASSRQSELQRRPS